MAASKSLNFLRDSSGLQLARQKLDDLYDLAWKHCFHHILLVRAVMSLFRVKERGHNFHGMEGVSKNLWLHLFF